MQPDKNVINKNWKSQLILKICIVNTIIPLAFLILNQFFVRYFSLTSEGTFANKVLKPVDMGIFIMFMVFVVFTVLSIFFLLKPLFDFIEKKKNYAEARVAAIRIPWFLIMLHSLFWIVGCTFYYWKNNWEPIHGMDYIWALLTDHSTGLLSAVFVILAINNSLSRIKILLKMTDMQKTEIDSFMKHRNHVINVVILYYALVHVSYIGYFYFLYGLKYGNTDLTFIPYMLFNFYVIILAVAVHHYSRRDYNFQIKLLKAKLDELTVGSINLSERLTIINFDDMGEVCMKINLFLNAFTGILEKVKDASNLLALSAHSLLSSSREIAAISNEQASSVKEVVSTVEGSDKFVNNMHEMITKVAGLIKEDKEAIKRGFSHIQESLKNMDIIKETNNKTILGIKSLGEQIDSIWDIARIINSIADQTKIIAFNAELEASAAGEAGRNFQIVAGEIRRLADKTVASTREIKARIDEIEAASDFLVKSSEEGTSNIKEEWELSNNIGKIFDNIRKSTEISTAASEQIIIGVNQIVSKSNQILRTLRQINQGIENFVESTQFSSDSAQQLKQMADSLNQIVATYSVR